MTREEAIKHCEEVANDRAGCCEDCAEEHRQLACWLKELKQYREQTDGDLISLDFMKKLGATCIAKRSEAGELVAISSIDNLPSVENTAEWIPVSERLPDKVGTYMTTVDYEKYGIAVGQRYYHGECIGWEDDCVIAWMPLPDPYKVDERSKK